MREALYALDLIASDLLAGYGDRPLMHAMEALMLREPGNWNRHYRGDAAEMRTLRHYSLSDRIRYYWSMPAANAAFDHLMTALAGRSVPRSLFWQHLPEGVGFADEPLDPVEVVVQRIQRSLDAYRQASGT